MSRRILPLALLIVAAAAVVGWLLFGLERDGAGGEAEVAAAELAPAASARPSDSLAEADEPEGLAPERTGLDALAATSEEPGFELGDALWLEGRVLFPAGSPRDDTLSVVAIGGSEGLEDWRAEQAAPPWWRDFVEQDRDRWARGPVAPDGTFRVPLPADADTAVLLLDGRYLFLEEPRVVAPTAASAPLQLEPTLGACLRLVALPPPGTSVAESGLAGAELELRGGESGQGMFGMMSGQNRELELDEDLVAEYRGLSASHTWYLAADPDGAAAPIGMRVLDLELAPGRLVERELQFAAGAYFSGTVVDERGAPIADARVSGSIGGRMAGFRLGSQRSATTDEQGRFALRLRRGKATLTATKLGWLGSEALERDGAEGQRFDGLVLRLSSGLAIRGTLRFPDGTPAAGATVRARESDAPSGFGARARSSSAEVAEDGTFAVTGLEEGEYDLVATTGKEVVSTELFPLIEAPVGAVGSEVATTALPNGGGPAWRARREGVPAGSANVALVLAEPSGLRGLVVTAEGEPVAEYRVVADSAGGDFGPGGRISEKVRDEAGLFLLDEAYDGEWTLTIEADGLVTEQEELRVSVPQAGGPERIAMLPACAVAGTVVDLEGRPVAGADVSAGSGETGGTRRRGPGGFRMRADAVETDEEGRFALDGLRAGAYVLRASGAELAPAEEVVELLPGARLEGLVLQLSRGGDLTGEIYDAEGRPSSGRTINVFSMGGGDFDSAVSDAAGRFELTHLAPGSYQVMAQPRTETFAEMAEGDGELDPTDFMANMKMASAEVVDGETVHVVLGAPPADPVRVFGLVSEAGAPVEAGTVMLVREGSAMLSSFKPAKVAADGTYSVVVDEPGDYVFVYQETGFGPGGTEFAVSVPQAPEFRNDLALPGGAITGEVRGPSGTPLGDQMVMLQYDSGAASIVGFGAGTAARSDADGRFEFTRLRGGTYSLRAGTSGFAASGYGATVLGGLELDEDGRLDGIVLKLSKPGRVTGTVRDDAGAPVRGATIFVRDGAGRAVNPTSFTTTGVDGGYAVEGVAPGDVTVEARTADAASATSAAVRVREGDETRVELVVEPGTILRVVIEDREGEPLRARLSVLDEAGRDHARLQSQASMQAMMSEGFSTKERRVGPLAPGRYEVIATTDGGASKSRNLKLSGQAERKVRLRLDD